MNREIVRKEDRRARLHKHFRGSLSQGKSKPQQINLRAGKHYTFFADCSRQCDNINLTLLRDSRTLIADTAPMPPPCSASMPAKAANTPSPLPCPTVSTACAITASKYSKAVRKSSSRPIEAHTTCPDCTEAQQTVMAWNTFATNFSGSLYLKGYLKT